MTLSRRSFLELSALATARGLIGCNSPGVPETISGRSDTIEADLWTDETEPAQLEVFDRYVCPAGITQLEQDTLTDYMPDSVSGELLPLVMGVIRKESHFNPEAVSNSGATGLMQLGTFTAHHAGLQVYQPEELVDQDARFLNRAAMDIYVSRMRDMAADLSEQELIQIDARFDPGTNIAQGAAYLEELIERFDNPGFALIAYNMGPTALEAVRAQHIQTNDPVEFVQELNQHRQGLTWHNRFSGNDELLNTRKIDEVVRYFRLVSAFEQEYDDKFNLEIKEDQNGFYAEYEMKRGDTVWNLALKYTDVLGDSHHVRNEEVSQVRSVSELITERSGIEDARRISVGTRIKIPLELVANDYLPSCDQVPLNLRRQGDSISDDELLEAILTREEVSINDAQVPSNGDAIYLIVDSGHGHDDPGTYNSMRRLSEADIAFDVLSRMNRIAESNPDVNIIPVVSHSTNGYAVRDELARDEGGRCSNGSNNFRCGLEVTTNPPHRVRAGSTITGVNLRVYEANAAYADLVQQGVDPDNIAFMTIHVNALGPNTRGLMTFYPGDRTDTRHDMPQSSQRRSSVYTQYEEVRERPTVNYTSAQDAEMARNSRSLAELVVDESRNQGIEILPTRPVRDSMHRNSTFIPNILRGQLAPAHILVEMANIANPADASLMETPRYRENLAQALVNAAIRYNQ